MEIPKKVREQLDKFHEAHDSQKYVISVASGKYVPKKGTWYIARHYHHIDRDRTNNEMWNLAPLTHEEHNIELHTKGNEELMECIYENMSRLFPEHEEHYYKYLIKEKNKN